MHDHYATTDHDPACPLCLAAATFAPLGPRPCGCWPGDPHLADCAVMAPAGDPDPGDLADAWYAND